MQQIMACLGAVEPKGWVGPFGILILVNTLVLTYIAVRLAWPKDYR